MNAWASASIASSAARSPASRRFQHAALLACVEAARVVAAERIARQRAHAVAGRRFHLDDLGTEVREVLRSRRTRDELRHVDDSLAGERRGTRGSFRPSLRSLMDHPLGFVNGTRQGARRNHFEMKAHVQLLAQPVRQALAKAGVGLARLLHA